MFHTLFLPCVAVGRVGSAFYQFAATTDSRDWRPALVEIERRAALPKGSAPTYSYQLDWGSPVRPELKACHGLDVPFLFDNVAISHNLVGEGPDAYWMAEQISEALYRLRAHGRSQQSQVPLLAGVRTGQTCHHGVR
jgi:para-nitrobenzyl esterase